MIDHDFIFIFKSKLTFNNILSFYFKNIFLIISFVKTKKKYMNKK